MYRLSSPVWAGFLCVVFLGSTSIVRAQSGFVLTGVGPINRSMGGAAVAAPIDAAGALHWNPASISGLENSEMEFGLELLYPRATVTSSVPFGPGNIVSGSTDSEGGVFPLPTLGLVFRPEGSSWTYGLGVFSVGGFSVNYPGSLTNPILNPPTFGGSGPAYGDLEVLQIAPTVAYQLTDRLSIGVAPTIDMARLFIDPAFISAPNGNGTYPPGTHTRETWGAGFQSGLFYNLTDDWHLGASYKSTQCFEAFRYNSQDALGRPRHLNVSFEYPEIISVGGSYTGFERWTLATDLRYFDFGNSNGLKDKGFDATGALRGLGWRSIFGLSAGAQYQITDTLSLRIGYSYNENPIPGSQTSANLVSPTNLEHAAYLGASYQVTESFLVSIAYAHAFENSINGPIVSPSGTIPGSLVKSDVVADTLMIGASVRFGPRCQPSGKGFNSPLTEER